MQVTLPSIGVSYMPHKLSRTPEEAKSTAAEYALSQLGYCTEGQLLLSACSHHGGREGRSTDAALAACSHHGGREGGSMDAALAACSHTLHGGVHVYSRIWLVV